MRLICLAGLLLLTARARFRPAAAVGAWEPEGLDRRESCLPLVSFLNKVPFTSYFGTMASFDVKLIPEFSGSGEDVVDWIEKVEMVCLLQTPAAPQETVIPLRLKGGAMSVYRQLSDEDKKDAGKVKSALKRAFALDKFAAYERFADRRLRPGESVDVFIAELEQLASLFGGMTEEGISCAFVTGLPDSVRQVLRAGARVDSLSLRELADRARAILRETQAVVAVATGSGGGGGGGRGRWGRGTAAEAGAGGRGPCFSCGEFTHYARACPSRDAWGRPARGEARSERQQQTAEGGEPRAPAGRASGRHAPIQCYRCSNWGHIAAYCPEGNDQRGEAPAPASSRV